LEASKKAYGKVSKWRSIANANGLKNLALRETRGLIIKKGGR
jgi:nucleoid-associated protein YgaU